MYFELSEVDRAILDEIVGNLVSVEETDRPRWLGRPGWIPLWPIEAAFGVEAVAGVVEKGLAAIWRVSGPSKISYLLTDGPVSRVVRETRLKPRLTLTPFAAAMMSVELCGETGVPSWRWRMGLDHREPVVLTTTYGTDTWLRDLVPATIDREWFADELPAAPHVPTRAERRAAARRAG